MVVEEKIESRILEIEDAIADLEAIGAKNMRLKHFERLCLASNKLKYFAREILAHDQTIAENDDHHEPIKG